VRRVLVLTAVDLEARALARHLGLARVAGGDGLHFGGGVVEVACVGLRAVALEPRLRDSTSASLVVSAGACGALSPALAEGALVVPEAVITGAGGRLPAARLPGLPAAGTLLCVDAALDSAAAKSRLWIETGALAVDMESAAILAWAARRGLPAAVVRAVSDPATRGVPADLAGVVASDGRVRPLRAVGAALARPRAIADAVALRRGTAAALASVAAAIAGLARA
jgi:hypothetical protein